jgi:pimeloyl-ACP methyl ester carboxylesterase
MPILQVNGTNLWYEETGSGPETIVFSHGLLWSGHMFREQVAFLKDRYRIITYDHRGQGKSPGTAPYDMETLSRDAIALIELLSYEPVHFIGLSMGGFVGMRVAARRPDLLKSLVLLETSADGEPLENVPKYLLLNTIVKLLGVKPVVDQILPIMFGKTFLNDPQRDAEKAYWIQFLSLNRKDTITKAVEGVVFRKPILPELKNILCPTLVITGEEDVATTLEKGRKIHQYIAGSRFVTIPKAGHTSCVEEPEKVNQAILEFLESI